MMPTVDTSLASEFASTADDILTRLSEDDDVAEERAAETFSPRAWAAAAEAGWLEALLAEKAGGLGLALREIGPIFTAAGRHLFVGPLAEHIVGGGLAGSAAAGSAAERLAATLQGKRLLAFVDPGATRTLAGPWPTLADGRLSGSCAFTRFADCADELLVAATSPDAAPPSSVLLVVDAESVEVTRRPSLDPVTRMARVDFGGLDVSNDAVVATGDAATELLTRLRAQMRIAIACELSGIADHAFELAVDYAKERHQFGRPIGSFQALQHILAEMAREAFGLTRLCRAACAAEVDDLDLLEEVSLVAKAHAAGAARSVVEGSLQVHGGIAFTVEHQLHRYYKHLLFLEGLYGDRREIHETLGRRLLMSPGEVWPSWR